MAYIVTFWFLFLIDSMITMMCFVVFATFWMSIMFAISMLCVVFNKLENNVYLSFNFLTSKYMDGY